MGIGQQLHYREYGSGPPLVILHGLLGSSGNWHTLASQTFGQVFRVLAVDQRNHGRSPHTDEISYDVLVDDLLEFLNVRVMDRAHLLGHSLGGKVAMAFALAHPERVDRLVIADMAPRAYPPNHLSILEAMRAVDPTQFEGRKEVDAALAEHVSSAPVRQFLLKNLTREQDGGSYRWQVNLDVLYRDYDRLNEGIDAEQPFPGPALFVRGEKSDYVLEDDEQDILHLFPHARIVTIPGAGHWLHADAPEAFGEAVVSFLSGQD